MKPIGTIKHYRKHWYMEYLNSIHIFTLMFSRRIVIPSTVKNDNHFGLGGASVLNVSVCMCYQRSLSVIENQCLTCSEMLMFLIVAVVLHALSLWWTCLKVRIDNIWISGTKTDHHNNNESSRCSPKVCIRLILSTASTSCYTVFATHYTRARVSKTSVCWTFGNA